MEEEIYEMDQKTEKERLLSVKEAARFIGISSVTLHRILKREEIEHYRVGHRILFSKESHILPYLSRNEKKAKLSVV
jgi:excisionase family DNA binding protein